MNKNRKKTIIFGSSGDIGKEIKKILKKDKIIEINSKELDLANLQSAKNFKISLIPDNIIFVSARNDPKEFIKLKDKEIEEVFNINLISFIHVLRNLLKKVIYSKKKCKIILITTIYSRFGRSRRFLYSVTKHALLGVMRNIAVELGPKGITINAISPGYVDTKMTRKNLNTKQIEFLKSRTPLQKILKPKDIAVVVKALLGNEITSISGQEIIVDGGITVNGSFGL